MEFDKDRLAKLLSMTGSDQTGPTLERWGDPDAPREVRWPLFVHARRKH